MKKIYTLIISAFIGMSASNAAIHTVTVADFSFTPSSVSATVGDTIRWVWASGTHTTTSTSVPSGASSWNSPIDASNQTFDYVVSTAGTYNYNCAFHPTMMTGTITVTSGTGIADNAASLNLGTYPNPFKDRITLTHTSGDAVTILNMVGEVVAKFNLEAANTKTVLDLSILPSGVYFVNTVKEGSIIVTKRIVKS